MDPFAAHVYQAILHTLYGKPYKNLTEDQKAKRRKKDNNTDQTVSTPESFLELRTKLIHPVKQWETTLLERLLFDKYAVPLIQLIIESDIPKKSKKKSKQGKTLADTLITGMKPEAEGLSDFIASLTGSSK